MNDEALARISEISAHWTSLESEVVMQIVRGEVANGAGIEKSFPSVRELKVVLPRRALSVKREGLSYRGFDELIRNVDALRDDERLLCFFIVNCDYMFAVYFRQDEMIFLGCLHGPKKGHDPQ